MIEDILVPQGVEENRSFGYLISDEVTHQGLAKTAEAAIGIAHDLEPLESIALLQLASYHLLKLVAEIALLLLVEHPALGIKLEILLRATRPRGQNQLVLGLHPRLQEIREVSHFLVEAEGLIVVFGRALIRDLCGLLRGFLLLLRALLGALDLLHHHLHERLVALAPHGLVALHDLLHHISRVFIFLIAMLILLLLFIIFLRHLVKLIQLPLEGA